MKDFELASVTRAIDNLPALLSALQPELPAYCQGFHANPDLLPEDLPPPKPPQTSVPS